MVYNNVNDIKITNMSPVEEFVNFEMLKKRILDQYFVLCRDYGNFQGQGDDIYHLLFRLNLYFKSSYERPAENFLVRFIFLVLSCAGCKEWELVERQNIADLIAKFGLTNMLAELSSNEKEKILMQLKFLKVVT